MTNSANEFRRESTRQSFVMSWPSEYVETAMLNQAKPMTSVFSGRANASKNERTQAGFWPPISDAPTSESRIGLAVSARTWLSVRS